MLRRTLLALAFASLSLVGASGPAAGKSYTLQELLAIARHGNQGILAGGAAATAMEAQVHEARRNWLPSGELTSLLTALPPITCSVTDPFVDPWTQQDGAQRRRLLRDQRRSCPQIQLARFVMARLDAYRREADPAAVRFRENRRRSRGG